MSRLAQRIGKLQRMREERLRVIVICAPSWATGEPGPPRPASVIGVNRKLSDAEAAKLLAEAVADWEAVRRAAAQDPATVPMAAASASRPRPAKTARSETPEAHEPLPRCGDDGRAS